MDSTGETEATNNLLLTASELMWNLNNNIHSVRVARPLCSRRGPARYHRNRYISFGVRCCVCEWVCPFNIHSIDTMCPMCHPSVAQQRPTMGHRTRVWWPNGFFIGTIFQIIYYCLHFMRERIASKHSPKNDYNIRPFAASLPRRHRVLIN